MKGNISNVTGAIDIVARNRYRESATACGVRRMKASDGMIRFVSLLLLSFLMSFMGNSTALAKVYKVKEWSFVSQTEAGLNHNAANGTIKVTVGSRKNIICEKCITGNANGLFFWDSWKYYGTYLRNVSKGDRILVIPNLKASDKITLKCDNGLLIAASNSSYGDFDATNSQYVLTVTSDGHVGLGMNKDVNIYSISVERDVTTFELSYNKGDDAQVLGTVPDGVEYDVTEASALPQYKLPANVSLYKSGFSLTGWNDGENTHEYGKTLTLFEDVTFTPVFTENKVARTDALAAVNATFSSLAFTESGTEKYYVTQASFNSESQDVYIKVDGKELTFDVINGLKITLPSGVSAGEFAVSAGSISADGQVLTYTGESGTITLTYSGSATNLNGIKLTYPMTLAPVVRNDIAKKAYAVDRNSTQQLIVDFYNVTDGNYQWYSNTTGVIDIDSDNKIVGVTSGTYSVPTSVKGTTYYYCVGSNQYGSAKSIITRVNVDDYVTFDFKNWPADKDVAIGVENVEKGHSGIIQTAKDNIEWPMNPILYPYDMAGYFGRMESSNDIAIVPGTGMKCTLARAHRPIAIYDVKVGDVIVIKGVNLQATDLINDSTVSINDVVTFKEDRAKGDVYVNDYKTEMTVVITKAGHFIYQFRRDVASENPNVVESIMVLDRFAPTVATDLDGQTHTIARGKTETFTVAGAKHPESSAELSYQWYRSDTDSIQGGTPIEGATEATYTTKENESYYYYCVIRNSETQAACVTTKTTHVQCTPRVTYAVNQETDADVVGEVPPTEIIEIGKKFTIEAKNQLLFKEGYTLAGWMTDSTHVYNFGESYDIVNDIVLYPLFTKNTQQISKISKNMDVTWEFGTSKGAPSVTWDDNKEHQLVVQQAVSGETQDFTAKITSTGFNNASAAEGCATVADNTKITLKAKYGTIVSVYAKAGETPSGKLTASDYSKAIDMTLTDNVLSCKYDGGDTVITITLSAGYYEKMVVRHVPSGMPVFTRNLDENYYCETGQQITLSVDASINTTIQWYKNTTKSTTGGVPVPNGNGESITVTRSTDGSDYYYVTVSNNYGTIVSKCAQVNFYSYITLDFLNWDEADATVYKMESVASVKLRGGSMAYRYLYPYGLAGYLAVQNDLVRGDQPFRGLYDYGSGNRYIVWLGLNKGEKVFISSQSNALTLWPDGTMNADGTTVIENAGTYNYTQNGDNTETEIEMLTSGHLYMTLNRATGIYSIKLPNKYAPVIKKDLEDEYVVSKDAEVTLSVDAELPVVMGGQELAYQWYTNKTKSNKGGTAIEGATLASYVIEKVDSAAYYYCLVSNTGTGSVTPTKAAAVGYYVTVTFNNNDSGAVGIAPKSVKVQSGLPVTIPTNQTLYKKGYTLSAWTTGIVSTNVGEQYVPTTDVTLYPVFTKNENGVSLAGRDGATTVTWQFGQVNGAAEYTGGVASNVVQLPVKGYNMDLGINMTDGKNNAEDTYTEHGFLAANNGNFTIPVTRNATVSVNVYEAADITINGNAVAYKSEYGEAGNVTFVYTHNDADGDIVLNIGNGHLRSITVDYPAPPTIAVDKSSVSLKIVGDKVQSTTAIVNVTGKYLVPGSTVSITKDAKGVNYTVSPTEITVASDGTVNQQLLITYAATDVQAETSSVVTVTADQYTNATTTVTYERTVAMGTVAEVVPVTNKTTWDWASAPSRIDPAYENTYTSFSDVALAEGAAWPAGVAIANLAGSATVYANNANNSFEGSKLYFNNTVKGTVEVEFSNISSGAARALAVNGVTTNYSSNNTNHVTTGKIPVEAGGVLLQGRLNGQSDGEQTLRIYKVTFTPDAETPEIDLKESSSSFTLSTTDSKITDDKNPNKETIYYTLDGTVPSATNGYKYTVGSDVHIVTNRTIKAVAVAAGKNTSEVAELTTDMPVYELSVNMYPGKNGRIAIEPEVEDNRYTLNASVTIRGYANSGYGLLGWTTSRENIGKNIYVSREAALPVTIKETGNEYWAVFSQGVEGTTIYDFDHALFYGVSGTLEDESTVMGKAEFQSPVVSKSISAPSSYPILSGTSLLGSVYTLQYWLDKDSLDMKNKEVRYDLGTNTLFKEKNQTVTLVPVFKHNLHETYLETRRSAFSTTWDFRRAFGAHPFTIPSGKSSFYATHAKLNFCEKTGDLVTDQVVDIPLLLNTENVESTDEAITNEDMDEWCTIQKGTKISIPSVYGAKVTLASYSKMNDVSKGGTTVNGVSADNIDDEYITKTEDGAYLYTWTVHSNEESVDLVIGSDYSYYKYLTLEMPDATVVYLDYSSNNDEMGTVKDNQKAVKSEQGYAMKNGEKVVLTAKRKRFNVLDYWIDGDGNKIYPNGTYVLASGTSGEIGTGTYINGLNFTGCTNETDSCYTIKFALTKAYKIQAVFKEKTSYTVNFMTGDAAGVVLPQQKVEIDEKFVMPEYNYNLYLEGYTLKYYIENDAPDVHYDFGHEYTITRNMRLLPVFVANEKALTEVTSADGVEAKWRMANLGTLALNNANGIMVTQVAIDENNKVDVKMDITAKGTGISVVSAGGVCEVTKSVTLTVPTTRNCVMKLATAAGASISKGDVRISTDSLQIGSNVSVVYTDTAKTQNYVFVNPARLDNVSVVYKPINTETTLDDVLIGSVPLNEEQLAKLKQDMTITYEYAAASVYDAEDKLPEITTKVTGGTTVVTQPTVTNPIATILLQTTGAVTIKTYTIEFDIKDKVAPTFSKVEVNGVEASEGVVGGTQSVSGTISFTFDHAMQATNVVCETLNKTLFGSVSGRTLTLSYFGLKYGQTYSLTVPAETFTDVYGMKYASPINFTFTTVSAPTVEKGLFDFVVTHKQDWNNETQTAGERIQVVPDDVIKNLESLKIPYGTLEEGTDLANAAEGTKRFRIFVPDGEYSMKGNTAGVFRSIPTTNVDNKQGIFGKVDNGLGQLNIYIRDYNDGKSYYTGRTVLTRNNVSVIGQSQDRTVVYNDPFIVGIDNTATMKINANVENTYFQDLTFENRFCNEQTAANPNAGISKDGGGAAAFYDNGLHTICKNVTMKAHEGTYSSTTWNGYSIQNPKSVNKTDNYYEDCQLWGTLYFLHDQGQAWWERPTIVLRRRSSKSVISFTEHYKTEQPWGYVLHKGRVKAENGVAANYANNRFALGTSLRNSPAVTFLEMKFEVTPRPEGYVAGMTGGLCRLHEYKSLSANGTPLDLTQRTISVLTPATGSDDPVLTAEQALDYDLHNVLGGDDAYDPTIYTEQIHMNEVKPTNTTNTSGQTVLTWQGDNRALCYFIFRLDEETGDTVFYSMSTDAEFKPGDDQANRWFVIRAANERGGLGHASKAVQYKPLESYQVVVKQVGPNPEMGWATVCLPQNVIFNEVEGLTVYAAVAFEGTTLKLKKVQGSDGLYRGRGYVIYAKPGTYTFHGTYGSIKVQGTSTNNDTQDAHQYSVLDGNPEDHAVSVGTLNIYTLDYKPTLSTEVGFYKYVASEIPARKAYLSYETLENAGIHLDAGAKLSFFFDGDDEWLDDDADAIQGVGEDTSDAEGTIYDLSGRRVERSQMRKGMIYVIDGKKVMY